MGLSNAERQRLHRERLKAARNQGTLLNCWKNFAHTEC